MTLKPFLLTLSLSATAWLCSCETAKKETADQEQAQAVTDDAPWSVQMAHSEMERFPEAWMLDFSSRPNWGYTQGLVGTAMLDLWEETGDETYFNYVKAYADTMISDDGTLLHYKREDYNIDKINAGKILFRLYEETGDERYKAVLDTLRDQMREHPRTSEGGFWHKKRYPHQMWLDGLYMGSPFLAQYAAAFDEPALFDDVVNQIRLVDQHMYDPETGLYFHGWDESREQEWADKETGLSPNFWGRSIGWFAMSLVDVMDYLPEDHPGRPKVEEVIRKVAEGIKKYQDDSTGLWYQVVDQGGREGNYLEATASSMYAYFLYKAVREGYLDDSYLAVADQGYDGLTEELIREDPDGTISLTQCCAVAGLGGDPYRSGSYEYYVGETIRDNDPKGTGPFIMASLERERLDRQRNS
ncbi:glycoside hydrolase family 105 protein [Catalinimonas alkaloidigena]|nr:glycoside hydrolase family 88 protein [Catalinimonas alkaloidigena]